jgi:uncharacterized protein (DUF305 family)
MTNARSQVRFIITAAIAIVAVASAPYGAAAQAAPTPATKPQTYPGKYPFVRADVDFVTGMISHHAQAIIMAKWAPTHGASKSVGVLCERIINAQTDEIAVMQLWLKDRNQPVPEAKPLPMKMMMDGVEHMMMMPGMLTDEQMKQLDAARGGQFDRLFLMLMIQHHRGAVTMVDQLFAAPGAGQDEVVYKFASDIYADQTTEIERMQRMFINLQPM